MTTRRSTCTSTAACVARCFDRIAGLVDAKTERTAASHGLSSKGIENRSASGSRTTSGPVGPGCRAARFREIRRVRPRLSPLGWGRARSSTRLHCDSAKPLSAHA